MRFSVVIPVYEAERFILAAMESVKQQTYKDYELILVDNGSTDNSGTIINDFINCNPAVNARCVRLDSNQGISGGRNEGIKAAKGDFICLLDADDLWEPQKLEYISNSIDKNPSIDFFWHYEKRIKGTETRIEKFRDIDNSSAFLDLLLKGNCLSPTTVVIRKSALVGVGGFDLALNKGQEDYDCWLRLAKNGAKFRLVKQPLSSWIIREDSLSAKHEQHYAAVIDMIKEHYQSLEEYGYSRNEIDRLWNKKLSIMYRYLGRELSLINETKKARDYYKKSIAINPFNAKSYAGIILSFMHI